MSFLDSVTTGPQKRPRRTFLYGTHGVGKTTWAAGWKNAIFLPTENGCGDLDVTRTRLLTTAKEVVDAITEVRESDYETLVLDSIDWTEKLVQRDLDRENFQDAFGRGAVEVNRRVSSILRLLDTVIAAGKNVVLIGHAEVKTVTRPDGTSWSAYQPKLTKHAGASVCEWADELLFAQTVVLTQNKQIGLKQVSVGVDTGERVLYTEGTPAYQAKHRKIGLKPSYKLSDVSSYLNDIA
jgi:hypothetical protein